MKLVGVRLDRDNDGGKFLVDVGRMVCSISNASAVVVAIDPDRGLMVKVDNEWIGGYGDIVEVER